MSSASPLAIALVISLPVFATTLTGCAAVCNPQNPGAAIQSNNPIGLTVGLAQFGACAGYNLGKIAVAKMSGPEKEEEKKPEQPAVIPAAPAATEPALDSIKAPGDAAGK